MFIKDIVLFLWESATERYQQYIEEYSKMPADDLVKMLKKVKAAHFVSGHMQLCNLVTSGCPHYTSGNMLGLGGCSMCNLHSDSLETTAIMRVLRDKSPERYAYAVRDSFLDSRGVVRKREIHEFLYSYAFTDTNEITDLCLELLLGEKGVYEKKPVVFEFETTASSITAERIALLKKYLPRTKIIIRIGVECVDEFIRNHWLNKNISNRHIVNANDVCKNLGISIIGNILFGIPGMTEKNNAAIFKDTLLWLEKLRFDGFSCSILDRKDRTLQGFLFKQLEHDPELYHYGISDGFHTGLPWLFTYFEALSEMEGRIDGFVKKLIFSQFNESYIDGTHTMPFNADPACGCRAEAMEIFSTKSKSDFNYSGFYNRYTDDPCYGSYLSLLSRQDNIKSVSDNLKILAKSISMLVWDKSESSIRYNEFQKELENYEERRAYDDTQTG